MEKTANFTAQLEAVPGAARSCHDQPYKCGPSVFDAKTEAPEAPSTKQLIEVETGSDESEFTSGGQAYLGVPALTLVIVGLCFSVFIVSVDRTIVTTAIPRITESFHSSSDVGWYGSAYLLTASAFQPLYGRAYGLFDVKWTFIAAVGLFELGSLLSAVSPNSPVLIFGRAVQGTGSAGILTGAFVVGTHAVPLRQRPVLFAGVGVVFGAGAVAGPLLGGCFAEMANWKWAFWINLPIGAVTLCTIFLFIKTPKTGLQQQSVRSSRFMQLDMLGNLMLVGACTMLFLALELSEKYGTWNSSACIGLICGFGATVIIFIAWIMFKGDTALIPPRVICQRTVAASCGSAFFIYGTILVHTYFLPIWFQAVRNDSAIQSGVHMIPYMLSSITLSMIAGAFVTKNGLFTPPAVLGTALGLVGAGLLTTLNVNTATGTWVGFEIIAAAGLGMAVQQGFSAVQASLSEDDIPIGTAAVVGSQSLGGAIFVSAANTIFQNRLISSDTSGIFQDLDLRSVLATGITSFRSFVPARDLPIAITLYDRSLQGVFILATILCGLAFVCSLCMEWRRMGNGHQRTDERASSPTV